MPVHQITKTKLPTDFGLFNIVTFASDDKNPMPNIALVHESFDPKNATVVRLHSECLTGDLFASQRCDCGAQLNKSLQIIAEEKGVLLYLRQEGRGIGLINKMKAYNAQDEGMDTFDANVHLGFEPDARDYSIAIQMLKSLEIHKIKLLTNNPEKMAAFKNSGIEMIERLPIIIEANEQNKSYLDTKIVKFGHLLKS